MERSSIVEREVKFEAPIGLPLPDLRSHAGQTVRLPEEQLVTAYFDTTDRRLWRHGLTLRHRTTGDEPEGLWTLKLPHPSDGPVLERTELTWSGPRDAVPEEALDIVRGVARHEPLRHLVVLETRRQRLLIRRGEDVVAELDDDLVRVSGGPRSGLRFRQVELELLDEGWNGQRVVRSLESAGARVEREAKLAKAIDLSSSGSLSPEIDGRSTMADVLRATLSAGLARLLDHDWRLRLTTSMPAAVDVHQARVATRRLRSDLKTFGDLLDPVWLRHVRNDLKWCGAALGELRDADVLAEQLVDAPLPIQRRLAVQREAAAQSLAEVLASRRYLDLLDRIHAGSRWLPLRAGAEREAKRPARKVMPPLVRGCWRAVRRQVRRSGSHPTPAQLHRIRIKAKQLRYAAEAATPVFGKPARRTASAAERVQTVLGQHHDAVAAEEWLRSEWRDEAPASGAPIAVPALSFEAGLHVADARRRRRKAERHWPRAWATLRQSKRRRWLHET